MSVKVALNRTESVSYTHLDVYKRQDVYGARKAGLECIAVSFGYGTEEELKQAKPLKIVDSAEGIVDFFA